MKNPFLLLLFIPLIFFGQNNFIGSIERLSSEMDDFISKDSKIEIIAKGFTWSEGPVWSSKLNAVLFSDVPNNIIYKWDEENGLDIFLDKIGYSGIVPNSKKSGTNGLTIDQQGNLIICMHGDRRIVKLKDWNSNKVLPIATSFNNKLFNSPNDLVYNSKKELFFTDPPYGLQNGDNDALKELQFNGVFRLSADGKLKVLIKNLSRPNGIAISRDEKTLYVANSDLKNLVIMKYKITDDHTGLKFLGLFPRSISQLIVSIARNQYKLSETGDWDVWYRSISDFKKLSASRNMDLKLVDDSVMYPSLLEVSRIGESNRISLGGFIEKGYGFLVKLLTRNKENLYPYLNIIIKKR